MIRRPPRSTRTDTLFPYATLFRSDADRRLVAEALDLTGGLIRNIALDAVLRAHHEERRGADGRIEVPLSAIVVAAGREYRKLDRPLRASTYPAAWPDWLKTDLADKRAGWGHAQGGQTEAISAAYPRA